MINSPRVIRCDSLGQIKWDAAACQRRSCISVSPRTAALAPEPTRVPAVSRTAAVHVCGDL